MTSSPSPNAGHESPASGAPSPPRAARAAATVVKLGGASLEHAEGRAILARTLAHATRGGARLTVVHGGGAQITNALAKSGVTPSFVDGLRVTDEATLEVVETVLTLLGKRLAQTLTTEGASAVALTGRDADILRAVRKTPSPGKGDLGFVGSVVGVNSDLLRHLAFNGVTPILAPLAVNAEGSLLNVNADEVASAVAQGLHAKELVLLTDVDGVKDAAGTMIPALTVKQAEALLLEGVAKGGMVPKLKAAIEAVHAGVARVTIANGARAETLAAILAGEIRGTTVTA